MNNTKLLLTHRYGTDLNCRAAGAGPAINPSNHCKARLTLRFPGLREQSIKVVSCQLYCGATASRNGPKPIERFIPNIVCRSNYSISHRFFDAVRKMSECFAHSTNEHVSDRMNENHPYDSG